MMFVSLVSMLTGACHSLPNRPEAVALLTLEIPESQYAERPLKDLVLSFEPVDAVSTLRSKRILYRRGGPVVSYYARHRWLALPAELIEQVCLETVSLWSPYAQVVRSEQGMMANRRLSITLLRLEQEFDANAQSRMRLELLVQLVDTRSGRIVGQRRFRYREKAPEETAEGGAVAAGNGLRRFLTDLRNWLDGIEQ